MTLLLFIALVVGVTLLACYLGRGSETRPQAPDTALGSPGSVGRDYGPLTDREFAAHEELLRELDK